MDFNDIEKLKDFGFMGFKSIESLWKDKTIITKQKGVYLVLNPKYKTPAEFLSIGVGGFFKNKNPNVSIEVLNQNYVEDSLVVYIGKAGSINSKATLHSRLGQYLRFGQGKKIGHWGGRLIWQLANHQDLIIRWKPLLDEEPRDIEKDLIQDYIDQFGKRPFANMKD